MHSWGLPEKFVGILSSVLVVQQNVGQTLVSSQNRFVGTVVGSLIGLGSFMLTPVGYGGVVFLGLAMALMNYLASFKPEWRYGVVAAVALVLKGEDEGLQVAWERLISIGIGVAIGTVASILVWPRKASTCANEQLDECEKSLGSYLVALANQLEGEKSNPDDSGCLKILNEVKELLGAIRLEDTDSLKIRICLIESLNRRLLSLRTAIIDLEIGEKNRKRIKEFCCEYGHRLAVSEKRELKPVDEKLTELLEDLQKKAI